MSLQGWASFVVARYGMSSGGERRVPRGAGSKGSTQEEMERIDCEFTRFLEEMRKHIVMYKQSFIDNTLLKGAGHNR